MDDGRLVPPQRMQALCRFGLKSACNRTCSLGVSAVKDGLLRSPFACIVSTMPSNSNSGNSGNSFAALAQSSDQLNEVDSAHVPSSAARWGHAQGCMQHRHLALAAFMCTALAWLQQRTEDGQAHEAARPLGVDRP